ncbi:MAG: Crp/Fnr family transcriptional regulator [Putridiphycobacter sp.]|nr:Crp/Fnr family transcriptional regulator [Putridiphycobacter sp.]
MYQQLKENIKNLVDISDEEFAGFAKLLKPISIKKRTKILEQGKKPESMYFVVKGLLYNFHTSADGEQHVVQIAKENYWVGDVSGHNDNPSSNFNIEALEDSELLELTFTNFKEACEDIPIFERYFRLLIQNAYYHVLNRIVLTDIQSAEEQYFKIMESNPDIILRTPQKIIASFIGIKPQSLSRIKKKAFS